MKFDISYIKTMLDSTKASFVNGTFYLYDLRYYKDNLDSYIKESDPDIVIMMYNTSSIKNDNAFKWD